ncbi:hypothetical protein Taro_035975 [Colocasia esculenta]|uniref:DYW domain-containing protein n=1 Tax=Colocasia esculenta TaxID=4460 RepID=A0A843W1U7_COLES|nr:hypothetical protein [Colocasia esculenta]
MRRGLKPFPARISATRPRPLCYSSEAAPGPLFDSAIRASIEKGCPQKALSDYKLLLYAGALRPGRATLWLVLESCRESVDLKTAVETHGRAIKTGLESCGALARSMFRLYLDHGCLQDARLLIDRMPTLGSDPVPGNLMIAAYLRNGAFGEATQLFNRMPARDLVSWNSMIAGCIRCLYPKEAISLFCRMISSGIEADGFTFSSMLSACARVGALDLGKWVHSLMVDKVVESNPILSSALVDMYSKCGKIELSRKVFDAVPRTDASVWNSMISGLAINGHGVHALEMFSRMQVEGVMPDTVTFVGILTACSHCALVDDGLHHFFLMKLCYMIEPQIEHYGAVVDLLARAGRLEEAHETIKAMPMEPDIIIWRALLSACRTYGRSDLGEVAIKQMAELGSGDYVLLSSIYSSAKRWTCAERVWKLMKDDRVRKCRGLSWVELGGKIHEFKAGDTWHPESGSVYRVVDGLMKRVRANGFVSTPGCVAMDLLEEEKEASLFCHSEKLAVAYAILKTAPAMEIRVSKNLRTCGDCHSWLKMVSKVLSRPIIMRDRVRFHHFEGGSCSCKDYW